MPGNALLRAILLCMGFSGFIMVSLGVVLLVFQFDGKFLTIGLMVIGTGYLVLFCFPNQGKRILLNFILLQLSVLFLMVSGLITFTRTEVYLSQVGILCFCLGLLVLTACNSFLVGWIISIADPEKRKEMAEELKHSILKDLLG